MNNRISKSGRGISTVIGTMFFLVLAFAIFAAILTAFQYQADLVSTQREASQVDLNRMLERLSITPTISGSTLQVWVKNDGSIPIQVAEVWVSEEFGSFGTAHYATKSVDSFVPIGATTNVLLSYTPVVSVSSTSTYTIKVVTALGTIATAKLSPSSSSTNPEDILVDKLVARPSVYAAFPNPFSKVGVDTKLAYFAIIVANPTNLPITLYQVSMQLVNPNNPSIVDSTANCGKAVPLWPKTSGGSIIGTWTCDKEYVAWRNGTTPITVAPYSAMNFTIKVLAHSSIAVSPINTVGTNTFSSYGQFGNTKVDALGTETTETGIPNIYQSSSSAGTDTKYVVLGAKSGISKTYNFTIENSGDRSIFTNSYLVINVPKQFGTITYPPSCSPDLVLESDTALYDGSHQLKIRLANPLNAQERDTFCFTTTSPVVSANTMYLFHSYMTGQTDNSASKKIILGPVSENLIQVIP